MFNTSYLIMTRNDKIDELLISWENTYKKGQLTLWIFMALRDGKKYVDEIKHFIERKSGGTISCEEQSLYRALRKYEHLDILVYEKRAGNKGPDRKHYYLSDLGKELFDKFIDRNIKIFYSEEIKSYIGL